MKEAYRILSEGKLPEPEDILPYSKIYSNLRVEYQNPDVDYYHKLLFALNDHIVFDIYWENAYHIEPSLNSNQILMRTTDIYECARSFRHDAQQLMRSMSETFRIDLETLDGLHDLKYKKSKNQRGKLSEDWEYHLHGAECGFENIKTGKQVEVIIITHPEFGYLDSYFFFNYMQTTKRFKRLAEWFKTHKNVYKAIELLAAKGVLTKNAILDRRRNVIAL